MKSISTMTLHLKHWYNLKSWYSLENQYKSGDKLTN